MLKRKCNCGKELMAGQSQCALCAMGLAPSRQVDVAAEYQAGLSVTRRDDSGLNCHATVAERVIPTPTASARFKGDTRRATFSRGEVTRLWPEDAPIR
jgi:hypothetical protein